MIGFQCAPQQQLQRPASEDAQQVAPASKPTRAGSPQLSQHCQTSALVGQHQMSLPSAGQQQQQPQQKTTTTTTTVKVAPARHTSSSSSISSSPSPTHTSHQSPYLGQRAPPKSASRRVSSPGYHSAASSPGSSSIASPVSSSASTTSSSGVSSAASSCNRSAASPHSTQGARSQPASQTIVSCTTASVSHGRLTTPGDSGAPTKTPPHQQSQQQHRFKHEPAYSDGPSTPTPSRPTSSGGQTHLLDHFPELGQDGLKLSWAHGANNRQALDEALASSKLIVSGDISLAEMSRYPVPIMARPPLGASDLTLETWLSDAIASRKGIKLTFTSTRTVEPAFRVLARHAQNLKGPLILSADILARPSAVASSGPRGSKQQQQQQQQAHEQQPVDAWTFLMLCRTRFPRSIISIGWRPATGHAQPGPELSVQPADSSTAPGPDPMFELDMMLLDQQGAHAGPQQSHPQFSQPILQLAPGHPHQPHHLSVVQQLAAVAAAAAAGSAQQHSGASHLQQQLQEQHRNHRLTGDGAGGQRHHFILSSNGSLNSSSGNSSGSPSPTSPIGHLVCSSQRHHSARSVHEHQHWTAHAKQSQRSHLMVQSHPQQHSSQVVGWPAMAAAAMVAASSFQQRCRMDARDDDDDERADEDAASQEDDDALPLNLNINEADPQHASQRTLSDLAQKIQSLQQQSSTLNTLTSSLSKGGGSVSLGLSGKLLAEHNAGAGQCKWEHISKKAALAHRLNSDSPSPVSTSPKQQQQHGLSGNLLCVKQPAHALGAAGHPHHAYQQHQHHLPYLQHHSLANLALMGHGVRPAGGQPGAGAKRQLASSCQSGEPSCGPASSAGYTREMIDKMASLVKEYNLTQAITFPVEARLMTRNDSLAELQRLLYQVGAHSTLTIVAQPEDLISVDELLTIRKHFTAQQLLFDLPDELAGALRRALGG